MTDLAVIMSIYFNDNLRFVKESIDSILNQTFPPFHFYLIFDGPVNKDVKDFVINIKDNRIKLFRLEQNGGLAKALNHLLEVIIRNPEYKYIARMDADDISMPDRFQLQRDYLIKHSDISCVGSWYQEIDEDGKQLSERKLPIGSEDLRSYYFKRTPFAHPSVMYKRELIEIAGFYPVDTILLEDNVLWGNALERGLKFANIPEFLFKFRIDKDFFRRRSGIKYGFKFILIKFKINRLLNAPVYTYFYTFVMGLIRMFPTVFFRFLYLKFR
jgi:glycosyltransferase involved in cell wall biosynthesis